MAKAVVEQRTFENSKGEIIKFRFIGLVGYDESGRKVELNLSKVLDNANKIAFETVAKTRDDNGEVKQVSSKGEVKVDTTPDDSDWLND